MIRRARPDDAVAVAGLRMRAWHVAYADILDPDQLPADPEVESWRERLRPGGTIETYVWEQEGRVAGFVSAGRHDDDAPGEGTLMALYVDPAAQNAGVGSALLEFAVQRMRERGLSAAVLWTFEANERARRFYERHGWVAVAGTEAAEPLRFGRPEVAYRRSL